MKIEKITVDDYEFTITPDFEKNSAIITIQDRHAGKNMMLDFTQLNQLILGAVRIANELIQYDAAKKLGAKLGPPPQFWPSIITKGMVFKETKLNTASDGIRHKVVIRFDDQVGYFQNDDEYKKLFDFVCGRPHGETDADGNDQPDFSYCCGFDYCRCMQ